MESPITRQFVFPVVAFNGGPGLQIRSAGMSALLITGLTGTMTITLTMKADEKNPITLMLKWYPAEKFKSGGNCKTRSSFCISGC